MQDKMDRDEERNKLFHVGCEEGISNKATFEQRPEGSDGLSRVGVWGNPILVRTEATRQGLAICIR